MDVHSSRQYPSRKEWHSAIPGTHFTMHVARVINDVRRRLIIQVLNFQSWFISPLRTGESISINKNKKKKVKSKTLLVVVVLALLFEYFFLDSDVNTQEFSVIEEIQTSIHGVVMEHS